MQGRWGVPCGKPNASPRVINAKTGGAALGHIALSLFSLLSIYRTDAGTLSSAFYHGLTYVCVV